MFCIVTCRRIIDLLVLILTFFFSDNIKALFRRAKAHTGAWNPTEAKQDFQSVLDKDPSLSMTCKKEIRKVEEMEKQKNIEDKQKMKNLF